MFFYYVISAIVAALIYWINYVPWHYKNEFIGSKKAAINRIRRLRKPGTNIPPPFPNGWYVLASSDDIKPGKAKSIDCLGENFVVFRSAVTKQVYVMDAYCPHMGANLGVGGIVNGECIRCPFHHWNFNGKDGSLVDIPYSNDVEGIKKFAQIKKWTCREVNKLIFVWYHTDNEDPWEIEIIPSVENGEMVQHATSEFEIYAHIQDVVENGADSTHFDIIHGPIVFVGGDITNFNNKLLSFCTHELHTTFTPSEEKKHTTNIKVSQSMKMFGKNFLPVDFDIFQIGPGYAVVKMKTSFGEIIAIQTIIPIEPLKQKFKFYLYGSRFIGMHVKLVSWAQNVNAERDYMVWNNKTFVRNPLLTKEEEQITMFRNWYSQFYSKSSKSFQDASNDFNW